MRRSTRLTTKRPVPAPDSSDEDEPKKTKSKKTKPPQKLSSKKSDISSSDEPPTNKVIKPPQSKATYKEDSESSSSESDIETYLKPADQIDLSSSFFHLNKPQEKKSFEAVESNIFSGINRLSESESEAEEPTGSDALTTKDEEAAGTSGKGKVASKLNFQQLYDYTKKLEEAKKLVAKYEANKKKKQAKEKVSAGSKSDDISNLLALGEAKVDSSVELQTSLHSSDYESFSDSEKEDWEEVEGHAIKETNEGVVPKDGVQITVALPGVMRKKKGIDLLASMKRRLNRIRKENQVLVHKVHMLCWLGHGNYVNQVLNNQDVLALALSLLPSQHCYPANRTDLGYLEQIVKWYKNTIPNVDKLISKEVSLEKALKIQINRKQAFNKKMLVYIFVCILRSLGIQCRLVVSFQVAPLRPPASELHSLSVKPEIKKEDEKASTSKNESPEKSEVSTEETKIKISKNAGQSHKSKKPNLGNLNGKLIEGKAKTESKPHAKTSRSTSKKISDDENIPSGSKSHTSTKKKSATTKETKPAKTNIKESQEGEPDKQKSRSSSRNKEKSKQEATPPGTSNTRSKKSGKTKEKTLKVPQVDGADDSDDEPTTSKKSKKPNLKKLSQEEANPCPIKKHPKRLKSLPNYQENNSDDDFRPVTSKINNNNTQTATKSNAAPNLNKIKQKTSSNRDSSPTKVSSGKNSTKTQSSTDIQKLKQKSNGTPRSKSLDRDKSQYYSPSSPKKRGGVCDDIISIMKGRMAEERTKQRNKLVKTRKPRNESDYDSDYAPEPVKTKNHDSDDEFHEKTKVKVKQRVKVKKDNNEEEVKSKKGQDVWVEVFLESEEKWISADVVKGQVHCINELYSRASHPITYVIAWNNDNSIKDITQRYCPNWNTVTRKLRIDKKWLEDSLKPFTGRKTARDKEEDEELARLQLDKPLPTAISEYKNHPLYVLKRHLLKFEALYPPEPATLGFIRKEPVYSRDCVQTLHSREVWIKHAKVVKPGEQPYKIVKARPKYDKLSGRAITDKPLEIFGKWQVDDYVPPTAENGIVPRNAYGNVELFKPCMLPKGTVHLQLPGLNKVAGKMGIDCASAMVGFDFHSGGSHPLYDGFVVCEEHSESLIAGWYMLTRKIITDQPLEIFGKWQVEDYVPPPAENGVIPRNAYGNVELYKACMLPKGTVHIQLAGLNKVAKKMNIDCAPAMVGFDFHGGWNHPVFDGFVVCEEHEETVIAAWYMEQEEQEQREQEKIEKRVYGNWKKLIKGLLIRERLKARYAFGEPSQASKKRKSKGPKVVSKKRRVCSDSESD